jgi:hypothetical protein
LGLELSGVVACLQELELACDELESVLKTEARPLEALRTLICQFFRNPSAEQGKAILQGLIQLKASGANRALMAQAVLVDGCHVNLDSLTAELQEVLEDLEAR